MFQFEWLMCCQINYPNQQQGEMMGTIATIYVVIILSIAGQYSHYEE